MTAAFIFPFLLIPCCPRYSNFPYPLALMISPFFKIWLLFSQNRPPTNTFFCLNRSAAPLRVSPYTFASTPSIRSEDICILSSCLSKAGRPGTSFALIHLTEVCLILFRFSIIETKNPAFSMLSSVKCRNSQEINDFSTLSDTPFYPLFQSRKYLQCCFHSNPEEYRKSTVRPDNC